MEHIERLRDGASDAMVRWVSQSDELRVRTAELVERLEFPEYDLYVTAVSEFVNDTRQVTISTVNLLYLTFRPLCILLWIILQNVWLLLLEHGGRSLQRGAEQFQRACVWFWNFQRSLTPRQLAGEIILVGVLVATIYFLRWLRRQSYWSKTVNYVTTKKDQVVQSYTKFVHRVAQVSTVVALAMPHSVFLAAWIGLKVVMPGFVDWIVHDTFLTAFLSVWYPLLCTMFLLTNRRHPSTKRTKTTSTTTTSSSDNKYKNEGGNNARTSPGNTRTSSSGGSTNWRSSRRSWISTSNSDSSYDDDEDDSADNNNNNNDGRQNSADTAATTTNVPSSSYLRRRKRTKANGSSMASSSSSSSPTATATPSSNHSNVPFSAPARLGMTLQESTAYWLRYWHVFAIVQAVGVVLSSIPIVGSFVLRHPILLSLTAELRTLFFIWLFGMEWMLPSSKDAFLARALPIRLVHKFVTPVVLNVFRSVSDVIPETVWKDWVVSKADTFLQMFVLVRALSSEWKEWIINVLKESRGYVIPSMTLFLPFGAPFGVAFVQYILPAAKSSHARLDKHKILYLQYWIIHCLVAGVLSFFSGILWWIPFSTHGIFVLWCYLALPHTIRSYYDIVEKDLAAFGVLNITDGPRDINQTTTAKLFSAVTSRLPSASDMPNDGVDGDNTANSTGNDGNDGSVPGANDNLTDSSTLNATQKNDDIPKDDKSNQDEDDEVGNE